MALPPHPKRVKPVHWVPGSKGDYVAFPADVQDDMGYILYDLQVGDAPDSAPPLKGYGSSNVREIKASSDGNTYRTVVSVEFENAIYVLHAFQKKSKHGIELPKEDRELIKSRLQRARKHHEEAKRDQR